MAAQRAYWKNQPEIPGMKDEEELVGDKVEVEMEMEEGMVELVDIVEEADKEREERDVEPRAYSIEFEEMRSCVVNPRSSGQERET